MVMLLDSIGERYGILPSEVMRSATTFDVFVIDTAIGYRNLLQERAANDGKDPTPKYETKDLQAMMERVRGQD
jgi:hypothetical protein